MSIEGWANLLILSFLAIPQALLYQNLTNYLKKNGIPVYAIFIFATLLSIFTIAFPILLLHILDAIYSSPPDTQGFKCGNASFGLFVLYMFTQIYTIAIIFWWLIFHIWQWWRGKNH